MVVAIFLYHYCTDDREDTEIVGVYSNYGDACEAMHLYMAETRKELDKYGYEWDADFENDDESRRSFGFYCRGYTGNRMWEGWVELWEVR